MIWLLLSGSANTGNRDDCAWCGQILGCEFRAPEAGWLNGNFASALAAGWGQEVGNRLVWMSNSTNSQAELVLTPPQMGRVEVSLSVTGDQATATFVSTNPLVREALEAAMPRLREILADAGIQLGQTQVGAGNAHQSAQQEKNGDNFTFGRNVPPDAGASQTIATAPHSASPGLKVGRGLVDVFA